MLAAACVAGTTLAEEHTAPTMEEVYANREIPSWFNEDKFGIFVVWGPYSVPSYKHWGYAEWYPEKVEQQKKKLAEFDASMK